MKYEDFGIIPCAKPDPSPAFRTCLPPNKPCLRAAAEAMRSADAAINPVVLAWARDRAGYSVEEAAKKIGVSPERYRAWENERADALPTLKQLRKAAHAFGRPVSLFYLASPPTGFEPIRDLRRMPGGLPQPYSPKLLRAMEQAQQRRNLAIELHAELGERIPEFDLHATMSDDAESLGPRIRKFLNVSFAEQAAWRRHGSRGPLRQWRRRMETRGVLVFQMSDVSSDEANGFAVAAGELPIAAINQKDPPNRRTFSLLHEFAHLLLGAGGTSDLHVDARRPPEERRIEVFCNRAAAAALMPRESLLKTRLVKSHPGRNADWSDSELAEASSIFGVSREAFLRRLLTLERTTSGFYVEKRAQYAQEYQEKRARDREKTRKEEMRRDMPLMAYANLGRPFVRLVLSGMNHNIITASEASAHLGNLRIKHFPRLEKIAFARG